MDYYQLVNAILLRLETPLFLPWHQGYGMSSLIASDKQQLWTSSRDHLKPFYLEDHMTYKMTNPKYS